MSAGQGSISFTNNPASGGGSVTGANNGLILDGANVQLGQAVGAVGDPAQLLGNREIPLAGFSLDFKGNNINFLLDDANALLNFNVGGGNFLKIDPINNFIQFGDNSGTYDGMCLSFYGGSYLDLGDTNSIGNNTIFWVDDFKREVGAQNDMNRLFRLNSNTRIYEIGECTGATGLFLYMDANTRIFEIRSTTNDAVVKINNQVGFTGTVAPVNSITVVGGIVTAVS